MLTLPTQCVTITSVLLISHQQPAPCEHHCSRSNSHFSANSHIILFHYFVEALPPQTKCSRDAECSHVSSQTDGFSLRGPFLLKLACNFPLHVVNGLHLYRAVIPKALHGASCSPTTRYQTTTAQSQAGPLRHLHTNAHTNGVIGLGELRLPTKAPHHGFSFLRHRQFILLPLFLLLFANAPPPSSILGMSFSSLVFLSI